METWVVSGYDHRGNRPETVQADNCYVESGCLVFTRIVERNPEDVSKFRDSRVLVVAFAEGEWRDVKLVTEEKI